MKTTNLLTFNQLNLSKKLKKILRCVSCATKIAFKIYMEGSCLPKLRTTDLDRQHTKKEFHECSLKY
jgi:hypothetical protein